jgi:hypothetical protein
MPLYENALSLIRRNLEALQLGQRVPRIAIGVLTNEQIAAVNARQAEDGLPLSIAEVVFVGRHIHQRRVVADGYEIDDVLIQIQSAFCETAEIIATEYMTAIRNPVARKDRLGNQVHDEAILECTKYRPNPDLFSVIPKGDKVKPDKRKGPP